MFLQIVEVGIPPKVMRMMRVFPYLQYCCEDGEGWPPTYGVEYGVGFGSLSMMARMVMVGSLTTAVRMSWVGSLPMVMRMVMDGPLFIVMRIVLALFLWW